MACKCYYVTHHKIKLLLSPTCSVNSKQRTIADQERIVFAINDISPTRRWSLFILAFETASGWRFAKFPPRHLLHPTPISVSLSPLPSSPSSARAPAFFQAYISTPRARRVIKRFISVFCKICGATACEWRGERCRGKADNEACCVGAKKVSGRCIIVFNLGPMPSILGFLLSNPSPPFHVVSLPLLAQPVRETSSERLFFNMVKSGGRDIAWPGKNVHSSVENWRRILKKACLPLENARWDTMWYCCLIDWPDTRSVLLIINDYFRTNALSLVRVLYEYRWIVYRESER